MRSALKSLPTLLFAGVLFFFIPNAAGDPAIQVSFRLAHSAYITGEPVEGILRIRNDGATPFIVDNYGDYRENRVHFEIVRQGENRVEPSTTASVIDRLMLMPGDSEAFRVNLAAFFPLTREDRYHVRAKVNNRGTLFLSSQVMFDVIPGFPILERTHVLPDALGVYRTYKLVYWPRGNTEQLFLRAYDNPGGKIWQTLQLGLLVRTHPVDFEFAGDHLIRIRRHATRHVIVTTEIETTARGLRVKESTQSGRSTPAPGSRLLRPEAEETDAGETE